VVVEEDTEVVKVARPQADTVADNSPAAADMEEDNSRAEVDTVVVRSLEERKLPTRSSTCR